MTEDVEGVEWRCDWQPSDLNPGPDCPYCAGEMCGRFDGLFGCTHNQVERHGYDRLPLPDHHPTTEAGRALLEYADEHYVNGRGEDIDRRRLEGFIRRIEHEAAQVKLTEAFGQGVEAGRRVPELLVPGHEHYWIDAWFDETAWFCTICHKIEHPGEGVHEDDVLAAEIIEGACRVVANLPPNAPNEATVARLGLRARGVPLVENKDGRAEIDRVTWKRLTDE